MAMADLLQHAAPAVLSATMQLGKTRRVPQLPGLRAAQSVPFAGQSKLMYRQGCAGLTGACALYWTFSGPRFRHIRRRRCRRADSGSTGLAAAAEEPLSEDAFEDRFLEAAAADLASASPFGLAWLQPGEVVEVLWQGNWYECEVLDVADDGESCSVLYEDSGDEEVAVPVATRVRQLQPPWVKVGMFVEVESQGEWCEGEVLDVEPDGKRCTVKYYEGGEEEAGVIIGSRIRPPRVPLSCFFVGQTVTGTVRQVRADGAFVDVGSDADGFIHISRMPGFTGPGHCLSDDDLHSGMEISGWVCGVDAGRMRLEITLIEGCVGGQYGLDAPAGLRHFQQWILAKSGEPPIPSTRSSYRSYT
eukprot:TRINITY_DN59368_c0_g2_i1.p1 TRINITY_DN59368_c0_g2~~TRINITY_DN59368_c0_g2_i1.p1  ORF type:complete len:378 (-),score=82.09 TRINITY_DN59368_c0_g2_i1:251-1330(-)